MKHDSIMKIWECYMGNREYIWCDEIFTDPELHKFVKESKGFAPLPNSYSGVKSYKFVGAKPRGKS